jgi:DNA-binding transcriptional ArsR family regulator
MRMRADMQLVRALPETDQVDLAVEVFRMLADATRVRLLWVLLDEERPVNDLATAVGKPPMAVSQHLAKLRMARLVRTRRQGNQVFYRIENTHVRQLVEDAIFHAEHSGSGVPQHHQPDTGVTELISAAEDDATRKDAPTGTTGRGRNDT